MTSDNSQDDEIHLPLDGGQPSERLPDSDSARIERAPRRRSAADPRWSLEVLEAPLLENLIDYEVHDCPADEAGAASCGWIEFTRPTQAYIAPCGDRRVLVRLTVDDGRLSITAPNCYPRNSLVRTTVPPPDRDGNLRVVRLGDHDMTQIDLIMAADGVVTASLRLETLCRPFTRRDIVQIADEFALGIDLLDFVVRQSKLLR